MRKWGNGGAGKNPSRHILGWAALALGIACVLELAGLAMGSAPHPGFQAVSKVLRFPVPYIVVLGLALLVVYVVFRSRPEGFSASKLEPTYFARDTTDFARFDSRMADDGPAPEPAHRGLQPPATTWSAQVFRDIEWHRFEAVCTTLFAQAGFESRTKSHGADGGVEIWLYSHNAKGPAAVVQCKHWLGKPAGVKELRDFRALMASNKLPRGTFATSSGFTAEAREFAKANGISALDGLTLLALISQRTHAQQQALLQIAYEGEYWRPTCANCAIKMVERSTRKKASEFWGCTEYPRCRFTLPVRGPDAA
jgi:restriction system protein